MVDVLSYQEVVVLGDLAEQGDLEVGTCQVVLGTQRVVSCQEEAEVRMEVLAFSWGREDDLSS